MSAARIGLKLFLCSTLIGTSIAVQAAYPDHPIHLIVPSAPGGGLDFLGRLIGQHLSEQMHQPVIVENRPGADNTLGPEEVAHSAPNGYTFVIVNANQTITPNMPQYEHMSFDPVKSFAPLISIGQFTEVLDVNSKLLPVKSVQELVDYAKAHPGQLNFSSAGPGSIPSVAMELFSKKKNIKMTNVSYKGSGPAMIALLGGEVSVTMGSAASSMAQIKAGKDIRALAVTTKIRVPVMSDIPTMAEASGIPDFDFGEWYGFLAPKGTPADIVKKLHDQIETAVKSKDIQDKLNEQGFITHFSTPSEFGSFLQKDIVRWHDIFKQISS